MQLDCSSRFVHSKTGIFTELLALNFGWPWWVSDRKNFIFSARCRASETSFGALVAQFSNFRAAERHRECVDRVTALESVKVSFCWKKVRNRRCREKPRKSWSCSEGGGVTIGECLTRNNGESFLLSKYERKVKTNESNLLRSFEWKRTNIFVHFEAIERYSLVMRSIQMLDFKKWR